jgi:hypothetical protein
MSLLYFRWIPAVKGWRRRVQPPVVRTAAASSAAGVRAVSAFDLSFRSGKAGLVAG